jgi:Family of unknown function (DUF6502)
MESSSKTVEVESWESRFDNQTQAQIVFAFRRLFFPLARILQRAGVPYFEFRDILKDAYIEAAIRDGMPDYDIETPSSMALALLLGIPVADIERLLNNPKRLQSPAETSMPLMAAIASRWSTDPKFQGPYGLPLQLSLDAPVGKSFSDLVGAVSATADPSELMRAMISNGSVDSVGNGCVKLLGRNLLMDGTTATAELFEVLGRGVEDFASTLDANQEGKGLFQRSVFSDRQLPIAKLGEFGRLLEKTMQGPLVEIDDWLAEASKDTPHGPTIDVGLTMFEYRRWPEEKKVLRHMVRAAEGPRPNWTNRQEPQKT